MALPKKAKEAVSPGGLGIQPVTFGRQAGFWSITPGALALN